MVNLSQLYLGRTGDVEEASVSSEVTEVGSNPVATVQKGINSRQDVISAIEKIEEYYYKNEPGSPIPLLLQRARNLVDKDFLSLMEDLSPDSIHQLGVILGSNQT